MFIYSVKMALVDSQMSARKTIFAVAALLSLMLSAAAFASHQHHSKYRQQSAHHQAKYKHSEHDRSEYAHSTSKHSKVKHSKYAHQRQYYGIEHRSALHSSRNVYSHPGYKFYLSGKHHHGERYAARDRYEYDRHAYDRHDQERREFYGLLVGAIVLNEVLHHVRH